MWRQAKPRGPPDNRRSTALMRASAVGTHQQEENQTDFNPEDRMQGVRRTHMENQWRRLDRNERFRRLAVLVAETKGHPLQRADGASGKETDLVARDVSAANEELAQADPGEHAARQTAHHQ